MFTLAKRTEWLEIFKSLRRKAERRLDVEAMHSCNAAINSLEGSTMNESTYKNLRSELTAKQEEAREKENAADAAAKDAAYGTAAYEFALRESYYQMGIRHGLMTAETVVDNVDTREMREDTKRARYVWRVSGENRERA